MHLFNIKKGWPLAAALFLFLLVVLAACDHSNRTADHDTEFVEVPLAQVGSSTISAKDVDYRIGIEKAYSGSTIQRSRAMLTLIQDTLEFEVATAAGITPSAEELNAFAVQVDKSTKAPELLAAVKKVFADDVPAYHRLYLRPKIINRELRSWFSRDIGKHEQQRKAIQQAWALVHGGQRFELAAETLGMSYAVQEYGVPSKAVPDALKSHFPEGLPSISESFRLLLDGTEAGAIVATIAEDDQRYRIVHLLDNKQDSYKTEEISIDKASFDDWFKEQKEKVKIQVSDLALKNSIKSTYAEIPWVKLLK